MGYYNGTANDMTAVRSALVNACTLEGWAWNSSTEMLSKGGMFLRLQIVSGYLTLLGRTSAAAGDMPNVVRIGTVAGTVLTFPLGYEIFVFAAEVYMVVNYNVSFYQWCGFGQSTVQGLPGTGMWVGATLEAANPMSALSISAIDGLSVNDSVTPALFWATQVTDVRNRNGWVHSNLDSQAWWLAQAVAANYVGVTGCVPLMGLLPNSWNSEAVLLPIRAYKVRPSSKISLVADLEHARYTRVDNYDPGQIITIGSDRWKVFPWYLKNTASRNGGYNIGHSGTFGWAIRYEGP